MKSIRISPTKVIILGYIVTILIGTALLMLPFATRSGQVTPFIDSFFTAASSTCVTGLVVFDTYTYWSLFGQLVILCLIQIGGLGFITMAIVIAILTRRRIGLKQRLMMQESIAAPQTGGIVRLTRFVFLATVICESLGAAALAFRYCPKLGFARGLYFSVFHSVSAFCNAGFDIMGAAAPGSSLMLLRDDAFVNVVLICLIVVGGLGFFVWFDLYNKKLDYRRYTLHTKIVLVTTFSLIVVSAVLFYISENGGSAFAGHSAGQNALASLFQTVSARTAGFNTVSLTSLRSGTVLILMLLMVIGGSPGSTAGGIKTTTFAIFVLCISSAFKKENDIQSFNRRVGDEILRRAITILTAYIALILAGTVAICSIDNLGLTTGAFEVVSAIGTVGFTLGATPFLSAASKGILVFLMFFGRVGCLTIFYAMMNIKPAAPYRLPKENIIVG